MSNRLEVITGFSTKEHLDYRLNTGNYLLAYAFRNGRILSPWFTTRGSFDKCYGSYISLNESFIYLDEQIGININLFLILYELDANNHPLRIIDSIAYNEMLLRNWIQIEEDEDGDLEPFNIVDHI